MMYGEPIQGGIKNGWKANKTQTDKAQVGKAQKASKAKENPNQRPSA